jgi:hypothetical protein
MRKIILAGIVLSAGLFADTNTNYTSLLKKSYETGLKDALVVLDKDINQYNKKIVLKGYGVYIDITNMPILDVIKYEALGIKLGFNPVIADNKLIFDTELRKADAVLVKREIENNSSLTNIKIKKFNTKIKSDSIIENYVKKTASSKSNTRICERKRKIYSK